MLARRGKSVRQGVLAEELGLEGPSLARLIDLLLAGGADSDARARRLQLKRDIVEIDALMVHLAHEGGDPDELEGLRELRMRMLMALPAIASIGDCLTALSGRPELAPQIASVPQCLVQDADLQASAVEMKAAVAARRAFLRADADWEQILAAKLAIKLNEAIDLTTDCILLNTAIAEGRPISALAQLSLERSEMRASVNGAISHLDLEPGAYVSAGKGVMALLDADTLHAEGYFEQTKLARIHVGDTVSVRRIGDGANLTGRVESIAAGIEDRDSAEGAKLLANVNPTFNWVRLAPRALVWLALDEEGARMALVAGRSATLEIINRPRSRTLLSIMSAEPDCGSG